MNKRQVLDQIRSNLTGEWNIPNIPVDNKPTDSGINRLTPKADALLKLEEECRGCTRCALSASATNLVFYDGNPEAKLIFIGEAPGADEDAQGKPFVGRAGKLLTATIEKLGLSRSKVYICNILKHRPPDNRNPLPVEIEACTPFLVRQLEILQPSVIVTLGNFSTRFMLNTEDGITKLRGKIQNSKAGYKIIPTYHPAAVLRNMNLLTDLENDIALAIKQIDKTG